MLVHVNIQMLHSNKDLEGVPVIGTIFITVPSPHHLQKHCVLTQDERCELVSSVFTDSAGFLGNRRKNEVEISARETLLVNVWWPCASRQFFTLLYLFKITFASTEEAATALLKWKSTFKKQNNSLLVSWQPSSDACNDWYGVTCINGRVNTLNITNANVFGTLYAFPFSSLPFLEYLNLSMNNLSGTIPPEIGNLTNLVCLDLHINQIYGTIPSQIGSLVKLQILRIFNNHLNGSIPGEIGQLRCLTKLSLGTNFLNGSIPASLGNLNNLSYLYLYENSLSGSIPREMGNLTYAKAFYAFSNELSGPIPAEIGKMKSLQNLSLYTNNLSGPIPSELGNLKNLNDLELSHNQLTGSIPSSFRKLRNLQTLFLGDNNLIEEIPSSICNLISLTVLYLSKNNLKGKILQCLGNISGLQYVMMSHNNLSGELPSSICSLTSLQGLDLGRNNLMGAIPQCLGNMSGHLEVLDMKHNNLFGTLPITFSIGSALKSVNLHGNKLEGKIPQSLENCKRLEVLDLGDNLLNDTFPMWLGTLPELRVLSLRSNKLHGPIRTSGSEYMFLELRILDLSRNDFSNNLPMSLFQHLKAMRTINQTTNASSYEFHRHYQDSVDVVTKGLELEVVRILSLYTAIDLSNNKFEGYIPSIMGELIAIRVLNLSHNGLQGQIPPSLGSLSSVESLDLSGNHLVGEIPAQFASLTFLEVLNLSYNHLEGCIPLGPQFHTFENNSYEGNDGLRGFPLSKGCGNDGHDSASEKTYAGSALDEESNSEFLNDFCKAALMGSSEGKGITEEEIIASRQLTEQENTTNRNLNFLHPQHLPEIASLQNLQVLKLKGIRFDKHCEVSDDEFPELKVLKLQQIDHLREWIVADDAFPKLECLVLRECHCLKDIPSWFAEISSLKSITVVDCQKSVEESARDIWNTQVEEYQNSAFEVFISDRKPKQFWFRYTTEKLQQNDGDGDEDDEDEEE
ncbi:hypothetical protein T459_31293 [Capsicum annuum]|uniref:Uncharacterized protein n=1 Tax=Capsicum annuum TaxID=4072 RepID=A0A2G2YAT7_CAPAN|nr:hypothetical protein T459_31293 [Capsicum annuum]